MHYATLGDSGITVSRLALGGMQFGWLADEAASFAVLDAFIDAGGTLVDTADIYSYWVSGNHGGESERIIGRWIASRDCRDRVVIATKVRGRMWPGPSGEGLTRAHIVKACEDSLKRLQVETIDLYQCHWPDEGTPLEEMLRAFEELHAAGKIRAIGSSNETAAGLRAALQTADAIGVPGFVSLQPHYNLVHRAEFEAELAALCRERGIGVIPYSPLAKGFLTGKYARGARPSPGPRLNSVRPYLNDQGFDVVDAIAEIGEAHGVEPALVALAWLLARPVVSAPIIGANTPAQLAGLLPAIDLVLEAAELARLDDVSSPFATA
jgi:aryl-alcohol dehydrogenase-like predicted oxidoreductase